MNFCVVGSGVVGLTTALELQSQYRDARVTILAHEFLNETTSAVAAGIWRPGTSFCGPNREITDQWLKDAYEAWDEMRKSSDASLMGVTQLSGYIFSSQHESITKNTLMEKLCPTYRKATPEELELCGRIGEGGWKYGSYFTTLLTDNSRFLPWASEKFTGQGGQVIKQRLKHFDDLQGKYDIVFNCTGLGAKFLLNDPKMVPIRGQVIKVKAPWIKTAFYGDYDTYIIPGFDSVTLGGVRNYDSFDNTISKYDSMAIRDRCETMVPSLKKADFVTERVGLRPHRDPVRVEYEPRKTETGVIKIIHNYGHGGYGVLSSPGTAKYAVKLVREAQSRSKL